MSEIEYWCFMKVKCTDGKIRLGINIQDETPEEDVIDGGYHYEYICTIVDLMAEELKMEVYDNCNPDYDGII